MFETVFDKMLATFAIALMVGMACFMIVMLAFTPALGECARLGYPDRFVANFTVSCAAREDGTDVVLPLYLARLRPRILANGR